MNFEEAKRETGYLASLIGESHYSIRKEEMVNDNGSHFECRVYIHGFEGQTFAETFEEAMALARVQMRRILTDKPLNSWEEIERETNENLAKLTITKGEKDAE